MIKIDTLRYMDLDKILSWSERMRLDLVNYIEKQPHGKKEEVRQLLAKVMQLKSVSSVRRKEKEIGSVNTQVIINFYKFIFDITTKEELFEKCPPEVLDHLETNPYYETELSTHFDPNFPIEEFRAYMESCRVRSIIVYTLGSSYGTSKKVSVLDFRKYGEYSSEIFVELVEMGAATIYGPSNQFISLTKACANSFTRSEMIRSNSKQLINNFSDHISDASTNINGDIRATIFMRLNRKGQALLTEASMNFTQKLIEIGDNPDLQGESIVGTLVCTTTLAKLEEESKEYIQ